MRLSCNTILFGQLEVSKALENVASAGFDAVEFSATKGMGEHLSVTMEPSDVDAIRQSLTENGLSAVAVEVGGSSHDRLAGLLSIAAALGVSVVNVSSGGTSWDEQSFIDIAGQIREKAGLADTYGITLSVKPHVGHAVFDTKSALRLVEEVREPNLGLNFDPSHLYRAGEDPAAVVELWGDSIRSSHFRDCATREQKVGDPETQIPGRGSIDLAQTLANLRALGFDGPLTMQIVGGKTRDPDEMVSLAAEGYAYLDERLARGTSAALS